jgi:hypothetical protein
MGDGDAFVASFHGVENDQDVEELSPGVLVEKSAVKSLVGCSITYLRDSAVTSVSATAPVSSRDT